MPLEQFYSRLDNTENYAVEKINYAGVVGGAAIKLFDVFSDRGGVNSHSSSGIASKFIKIAGDHSIAQIRYNLQDGDIQNSERIMFRLTLLFKPEIISEINILEERSRSVQLFLRDDKRTTNVVTLASSLAYFTETNNRETLELTFTSGNLSNYDRLIAWVVITYKNPIDEEGIALDEDLVKYIVSLTANENIGGELSIVAIEISEKLILYSYQVYDVLFVNEEILSLKVYNSLGQKTNKPNAVRGYSI